MAINYSKSLGKRLANFNSKYYNPPVNTASKGQCVWYTQGRAYEKKGVFIGARGNAKDVYNSCKNSGFQVSWYPKSNSIACFNGGTYGHVRYVEYVIADTVYFTEANWNADNVLSPDDGILKKMSLSNWMEQANLQGHVVVKKENLIKFKNLRKNGKIPLYTVAKCNLKDKARTVKADTISVVSGSGKIAKNGKDVVRVIHDNRYYWTVRTGINGSKKLKKI